jgi:hypothetical protein
MMSPTIPGWQMPAERTTMRRVQDAGAGAEALFGMGSVLQVAQCGSCRPDAGRFLADTNRWSSRHSAGDRTACVRGLGVLVVALEAGRTRDQAKRGRGALIAPVYRSHKAGRRVPQAAARRRFPAVVGPIKSGAAGSHLGVPRCSMYLLNETVASLPPDVR